MLGSKCASKKRPGDALALFLPLCLSGCMLVGYDGLALEPRADGGTHLAPEAGPQAQTEAGRGDDDGSSGAGPEDSLDAGEDGHAPDAPDAESTPDSATDLDAAEPEDADTHEPDDGSVPEPDAGAPWWTNVPPTQACSLFACSQQCTKSASPCVFQCSETACNPACDAGTRCRSTCSGSTCAHTCGANADCSTVCSALSCYETCAAGSSCEVDCSGACNVSCAAGARCLLKCSGLVCSMTCAAGAQSCPGNITVCGRDCPPLKRRQAPL